MSLFQAREWWSHKPDQSEECHDGCLCVANIDNDPKGTEKIITGSFQGVLRIFTPRQQGYKVDDLMEFQLDEPILQVDAGRFVSQGSKLSLAVLHPRKLVVYNVVAIGANGKMVASSTVEQASYYDLNKAYEHRLERTAYNFCFGPFGGVYGKDFICVQSMDGQLSFLEQENFAFSRFLSNFLLPGPLCYVAKIDSFVTVNSNMDVESYKYQVLGSSHGAEKKSEDGPSHLDPSGGVAIDPTTTTPTKKLQVDWTTNLGESVQSIFVARYSRSLAASNVDILVVGEHTLFTLKENGSIRLQKRLDFNPSSAVTYANSELADGEKDVGGSNQNLIIATHQSSCMIYKDMQLVWAARTSSVPIAVRVAAFAGVKGFLVTLSDACELQVSFLGTDPPLTGVSASESAKELDYEAMDEEHRALLKVIKQASTDSMIEPKEKIVIRAQVANTLSPGDSSEVYTDMQEPELTPDEDACVKDERTGAFIQVLVRLYLQYNGKSDIENLHLSLSHSPAFRSSSGRQIVIPSFRGGTKTPFILTLRFRVVKGLMPADLHLGVIASYITSNNEPRTARLESNLPLVLAAKIVAPLKNCQYMFTLDSNRPPPAPQDTFGDLLEPAIAANPEIARTSANVLTFVFHGTGCDVTILTSQKTGRFRLQSSVFEALNLITDQLHVRLNAFYSSSDSQLASAGARSDQPPFKLLFKDQHLPLADYFVLIDKHFATRQAIATIRTSLEKLAHQFRVIQKRLLVRYKDKNPAPLLQLDVLMTETYQQLQDQSVESLKLQSTLREAASQLASATNLMLLLIRFKCDLDDANVEVLRANLNAQPATFDATAIGWEECVDAALTHLLRTVLAKGAAAKDAFTSVAQPIEPMTDVAKMKKHIQIVCDRLAKGLRLVRPEKTKEKTNANAPTNARPSVPQQPSAPPAKTIPTPQTQQAAPAPQRRQAQQQQEALREEEEGQEGQE